MTLRIFRHDNRPVRSRPWALVKQPYVVVIVGKRHGAGIGQVNQGRFVNVIGPFPSMANAERERVNYRRRAEKAGLLESEEISIHAKPLWPEDEAELESKP